MAKRNVYIGLIDFGSNTIRLLIYEVDKDNPTQFIQRYNKKTTASLAGYLDRKGNLKKDGVKKAIDIIKRYQKKVASFDNTETYPPKEEQKEIVKYLDSVFIKIDSLIRNTEQIVERLRELKTRLISDVVTGQIDVRNIEIPEYEYVDEEPEGDSDDVNGDFDSEEISEEA